VKRFVIALAIIMGLLIPNPAVSTAAEKCLSNFSDAEWVNGTPTQAKALLGFDLVEKITISGGLPSLIGYDAYDSYQALGEHIEKITYNYLGKNCTSRDVVITKTISEVRPGFYRHKTIESAISQSPEARNFVLVENGKKLVINLRDYFSKNTFQVSKKISISANNSVNISGSPRDVFRVIGKEAEKIGEEFALPTGLPMISFPTRCSFFRTNDVGAGKVKLFALSIRHSGGIFAQEFVNNGECIGELRYFGVEEKIADIRYEVSDIAKSTSITCIKGKKSMKVNATAPVCPKEYKKKF